MSKDNSVNRSGWGNKGGSYSAAGLRPNTPLAAAASCVGADCWGKEAESFVSPSNGARLLVLVLGSRKQTDPGAPAECLE